MQRKLSLWLLCVWSAVLLASSPDSLYLGEFWSRYSAHPATLRVDSSLEQYLSAQQSRPVRFVYDVDFLSYFDNREYRQPFARPCTHLNFRLSPTVGLSVRDRSGGQHLLSAGVSYTQRLGGDWHDVQFSPIAYYRYRYRGLNLHMGAIPYSARLDALPDWVMSDSLVYMHPNIQGALFTYADRRGFVQLMCDWRSAQTDVRREMFRIVLDGQYGYRWFTLGGLAQLNHKAGLAGAASQRVMDDISVNPQLGVNLTHYTPLDSLAFRVGYIFDYQCNRNQGDVYLRHGMLAELYAQWWFLGLRSTLYYGQNLQPLRPLEPETSLGDPFYQAPLYSRTDLFFYLYRSRFLDFYFSWNFHYDTHSLQHQQQLIVRFSLDGLFYGQRPLRALFDR